MGAHLRLHEPPWSNCADPLPLRRTMVRSHLRSHTRRLLHARLAWRSSPHRPSPPWIRIHRDVFECPRCIWCFPESTCGMRNARSVIPLALLPADNEVCLGVCFSAVLGDNVPHASLPHRRRRGCLPRHRRFLYIPSRRVPRPRCTGTSSRTSNERISVCEWRFTEVKV